MAQSFFDKLTGTLKAQDADKQKSGALASSSAPASASASSGAKQEEHPAPAVVVRPVIEKEVSHTIADEKSESSWHSEVEGQLTVDVYQTPEEIVIKSTIAGVEIGDLDISITNDMVTVKGDRKKDEEVPAENYYHQECYWGPFSRSIILPVDIDSEKSKASFKNGILTIKLPKSEKIQTKKIKISG